MVPRTVQPFRRVRPRERASVRQCLRGHGVCGDQGVEVWGSLQRQDPQLRVPRVPYHSVSGHPRQRHRRRLHGQARPQVLSGYDVLMALFIIL